MSKGLPQTVKKVLLFNQLASKAALAFYDSLNKNIVGNSKKETKRG